jgi:hypothetical protein
MLSLCWTLLPIALAAATSTRLPKGDAEICAVVDAILGPRKPGQEGMADTECAKAIRRKEKENRLPVRVRVVGGRPGKFTQKDVGTPGRLCGKQYILYDRGWFPAEGNHESDPLVTIELGKTKDGVRFYSWIVGREPGAPATAAPGTCAADSGNLSRSGATWQVHPETHGEE